MGRRILSSLIVAFFGCVGLSRATNLGLNDVELAFSDFFDYEEVNLSEPIVPWSGLRTHVQSKVINIVYVCDKRYLPYTYPSLISILKTSKHEERREPIVFTIILDEIEFNGTLDSRMNRFLNAFFYVFDRDTYKYDIKHIPIPARERERINQFNSLRWPKSIFLKLFFSDFLPYDRCLYIDGDIICLKDIRDLWNIDLGDKCLGGTNYGRILGKSNSSFYSGGLWLFDLKKMRNNNFMADMGEFLKLQKPDSRGAFLEETALDYYIEKHGGYDIGCEFNLPIMYLHRSFTGPGWKWPKASLARLQKSNPALLNVINNLAIMHFERPKPLQRVQLYKEAGYPDYRDSNNNFWKKSWKASPWTFCMWHKYYRLFKEIENSEET